MRHAVIALVLAACSLVPLVACSDNDDNGRSSAEIKRAEASYTPSTRAGDGEVLALVMAVDQHEIDAANTALNKRLTPAVADFARMLREEHSANKAKGMKASSASGASPMTTGRVKMQQEKGAQELASLKPLEGAQFEQQFLAAMVKGHTEALSLIDNDLMAASHSSAVREHLRKTRAAVAKHLDMAKQLQSGMLMMTR
ncbi:MAG TPA: DUF4142 domain-containing protein [Phycisphaerales bacterium]|nr:DUF4142 domain-containing protein [Phycisphaerales bacterium]